MLLILALVLNPQWHHVKDGYSIHERYVITYPDKSVQMIGEYYQVQPGDVEAVCASGKRQSFSEADTAREFVLECE